MRQLSLFLVEYIYPRWRSMNLLTRIGFSLILGSGFEAACLALFLPEYPIRRLMLIYPGGLGFWCIVPAGVVKLVSWSITRYGRGYFAKP